jgi:hypothetical protein
MHMTIHVPDEEHRHFKILAAQHGITLTDLIREGARMWEEAHAAPKSEKPTATNNKKAGVK